MEKIVGGTIGLALGIWLFVAQPMMRNYTECGTVFLCSAQR